MAYNVTGHILQGTALICVLFIVSKKTFPKDHVDLPERERKRWQKCKDAGNHVAGFDFLRTGVYNLKFSSVRASQHACKRDIKRAGERNSACVRAHVCLCYFFQCRCSLAQVLRQRVLTALLKMKLIFVILFYSVWIGRYKTARNGAQRKRERGWLIF